MSWTPLRREPTYSSACPARDKRITGSEDGDARRLGRPVPDQMLARSTRWTPSSPARSEEGLASRSWCGGRRPLPHPRRRAGNRPISGHGGLPKPECAGPTVPARGQTLSMLPTGLARLSPGDKGTSRRSDRNTGWLGLTWKERLLDLVFPRIAWTAPKTCPSDLGRCARLPARPASPGKARISGPRPRPRRPGRAAFHYSRPCPRSCTPSSTAQHRGRARLGDWMPASWPARPS